MWMFAGLPVVLPDAAESVLVGSAILGACASGHFSSVQVPLLQFGDDQNSRVNAKLRSVSANISVRLHFVLEHFICRML